MKCENFNKMLQIVSLLDLFIQNSIACTEKSRIEEQWIESELCFLQYLPKNLNLNLLAQYFIKFNDKQIHSLINALK